MEENKKNNRVKVKRNAGKIVARVIAAIILAFMIIGSCSSLIIYFAYYR